MIGLRLKYEIFSTGMQFFYSSPFHALLVDRAKYYHLSNILSCMEDKQHACIISKQKDDKMVKDQRAQTYFMVPNLRISFQYLPLLHISI